MNDKSQACLADFGLSAITLDPEVARSLAPTTSLQEAGSTRWMAPELFVQSRVTAMSDVYALGMVALEVRHSGSARFYCNIVLIT